MLCYSLRPAVKSPALSQWSQRWPRPWREGKYASYTEEDWRKHEWTPNLGGTVRHHTALGHKLPLPCRSIGVACV